MPRLPTNPALNSAILIFPFASPLNSLFFSLKSPYQPEPGGILLHPDGIFPSVALNLIHLLILLFVAPEIVRADMNNRDAAKAMIISKVVSFPADLGFLMVGFMFS